VLHSGLQRGTLRGDLGFFPAMPELVEFGDTRVAGGKLLTRSHHQ
jgi:hypothetical protein